MKDFFVTYNNNFFRNRKREINKTTEFFLNQIVNSEFQKQYFPSNYYKQNKLKVKHIIRHLIVNFTLSTSKKLEDVKISLDKNILSKHHISLKLYSAVISRMLELEYIDYKRGFFNRKIEKKSRTTLIITNKLKSYICTKIIHPTLDIKAKAVKIEKIENKWKFTFQDKESNFEYGKFFDKDDNFFEGIKKYIESIRGFENDADKNLSNIELFYKFDIELKIFVDGDKKTIEAIKYQYNG